MYYAALIPQLVPASFVEFFEIGAGKRPEYISIHAVNFKSPRKIFSTTLVENNILVESRYPTATKYSRRRLINPPWDHAIWIH